MTSSSSVPTKAKSSWQNGGRGGRGRPRFASTSRRDQYRLPHRRRSRFRLPGVPPSDGGLVEVAGQMVSAAVAVRSGHQLDPGQDPSTPDRRLVGMQVETLVAGLDPGLRGWGNYFRRGNSAGTFNHIDNYVDQGLAHFASIKHGLPGCNWCGRFRPPLGHRRQRSTARPEQCSGCACLTVNDVGEPCAGEPGCPGRAGRGRRAGSRWPRRPSTRKESSSARGRAGSKFKSCSLTGHGFDARV
jgi:hypothetical protein